MATVESGPAAASNRKVLVATQNSKFKRALVSEIHDELNQNSIYMKIIDVKRLKNQSGAEFSAVVIINKCMAGRIPGWKALSIESPGKIKSLC